MKIKYQDVKRIANEMLNNVSVMERELAAFRQRTNTFAGEMQDQISEQAIELVTQLSETIRNLRTAIENGMQTLVGGTEKLNATEKSKSQEISRA